MMHNNRYLFFFILIISVLSVSFIMPDKILKKVRKEIKNTFDITDFKLQPIVINKSINQKLTKNREEHLFKIINTNIIIGYAFVDKAPSKTDEFDYLILLDKNLIIAKIKVLIYREDYGGEIGSKRWLQQFIGKRTADKLKYEKDIIAISGATISAYSMTKAVNNFLLDIDILHKNKVL